MAEEAGRLQEEALKRRERLRALRERQLQNRDKDEKEPANKQFKEDDDEEVKHRELKLRNYVPEDKELKERLVPNVKPASVEDKVKDQLEAGKPEPVIEEVMLPGQLSSSSILFMLLWISSIYRFSHVCQWAKRTW
ncbi:coiled-coil domain-containing protein 12 isoform X2 [Mobula birostris]|uniref:coiled-coil domain-containing protein 12 isoform X2 n=1 Tax=Mobula birostris TaxID=1983395 RepID=UPI003B285F73